MSSYPNEIEYWITLPTGDLSDNCRISALVRGNQIVGPFILIVNNEVACYAASLADLLASPEFRRIRGRNRRKDFRIVHRIKPDTIQGYEGTTIEYDENGDLIYVIEIAGREPVRTNRITQLFIVYYGQEQVYQNNTPPPPLGH